MPGVLLYLLGAISIYKIEAAKILTVIPTPSLSHQVVLYPLVQELAKRGHEVVFVTTNPAFPKDKTPNNLTEIDLQELSYGIWKKEFSLTDFGKENFVYKGVKAIVEVSPKIFQEQMKTEDLQSLIKNGNFDLIILQAWFRPTLIWSHIYKVPVVKVSSLGMLFDNAENMGAPFHPFLYPESFHQRIYKLSLWEMVTELQKRYYVDQLFISNEEAENEIVRSIDKNVPPLSELARNVHMMFLNVNPLWDRNRPLPSNVIYFGRVHQRPAKILPKDIESFLDSSPQGVIYMSFGTNVPPSRLPARTLQAFLKVFTKVPYNVLWKWDMDELPGKPKNVMIKKWFPQSDIFRHPNMKLVITQGGLQTTEEAIENGLPMVGIPFLADQWVNVENYVHHGIGVQLDLETLTEEMFEKAVLGVIQNDRVFKIQRSRYGKRIVETTAFQVQNKEDTMFLYDNKNNYRNNVLRLRDLLKDQPTTSLERTMLWIEYMLKHGGCSHLRPLSANISRSEYMEVELLAIVIAFVLTIVLLIIYLALSIVRYVETMVKETSDNNK